MTRELFELIEKSSNEGDLESTRWLSSRKQFLSTPIDVLYDHSSCQLLRIEITENLEAVKNRHHNNPTILSRWLMKEIDRWLSYNVIIPRVASSHIKGGDLKS